MGDTDSRGEKGIKGVWRGRGQVRRQDVHEWGPQAAGEGAVNGGLQRQNGGTHEKGDGEERVHGKEAWRKWVGGSARWPFRVEESSRLTPTRHCPWECQGPGVDRSPALPALPCPPPPQLKFLKPNLRGELHCKKSWGRKCPSPRQAAGRILLEGMNY